VSRGARIARPAVSESPSRFALTPRLLLAGVVLTALLLGPSAWAGQAPPKAQAILVADASELEALTAALVEGQKPRGELEVTALSWEVGNQGGHLARVEGGQVVIAAGGPFDLTPLVGLHPWAKKARTTALDDYLVGARDVLERLGLGRDVFLVVTLPPAPTKKRRKKSLVERAIAGLQTQCEVALSCELRLWGGPSSPEGSAPAQALPPGLSERLMSRLDWVDPPPLFTRWDDDGRLIEPTILAEERLFIRPSEARRKEVRFWAFLPQAEEPGHRFPVLYLLHGATGDYRDWRSHAKAELMDLASTYGLVIITPDGDPYGWYLDSPLSPSSQLESYFLRELIPYVEESSGLPVAAGASNRAIAGLSMGGHGALALALRNPGTFRSASSMSGILDLTSHPESWEIAQRLGPFAEQLAAWEDHSVAHLLRAGVAPELPILFVCGDADRAAWTENLALHEELTETGREHEWRGSTAGHSWSFWTEELPEHVAFAAEYLRGDGSRPPAPEPAPSAESPASSERGED
jgi:S-formylglutathione hydrolase FrmB